MASLMIHLLVAQEYCKKHNVANESEFINGNLAPDMVSDKQYTHFSKSTVNKSFIESVKNKVDLNAFCEENDITDDFKRGEFLHLITDDLFFRVYLINTKKFQDYIDLKPIHVINILYRDYHRSNAWMMQENPDLKLDLLPDIAKETRDDIDNMEIMSLESIRKLVRYCSNLDLDRSYRAIINKDKTCVHGM